MYLIPFRKMEQKPIYKMNIDPNSQHYQDVLKQLYWKLDDDTPSKEQYTELILLLKLTINAKHFTGLCNLCKLYTLLRAKYFITPYIFQYDLNYMTDIGDKEPRILWLEHYISNYENRSLWYKVKSFFKS